MDKSIYTTNDSCWYSLAGEIIKNAAIEQYTLRKRKAELQNQAIALSTSILNNTDLKWKDEVYPLLLSIKISNQQLEFILKKMEGHTRCNDIRLFRRIQNEQQNLEKKLRKCDDFFNSRYFKSISLGVDAEIILRTIARNLEEEEAWKYISKVETETGTMFKITPTPRQRTVLKNAGYDNFLFDEFEKAKAFRDEMLTFCQNEYRNQ